MARRIVEERGEAGFKPTAEVFGGKLGRHVRRHDEPAFARWSAGCSHGCYRGTFCQPLALERSSGRCAGVRIYRSIDVSRRSASFLETQKVMFERKEGHGPRGSDVDPNAGAPCGTMLVTGGASKSD